MLIRKLTLNNYSIHEHLELDFAPGINGIIGPNGSGKSTILDALRFAVTGTSILDGNLSDNVTWGEKSGGVTLVFTHGDSEYTIQRKVGRTSSQALTTPTGQITKQAEIKDMLEGLFGATFDSLLNNVFIQQGRIESILFATNTQRLREIQKIVGLDSLSTAEKALGLEVNSIQLTPGLKEQVAEVSSMVADARKEEQLASAQLQQIETQVKELEPYSRRLDAYLATEKSRAALQRVEADILTSEEEVRKAGEQCKELQQSNGQLKAALDTLEKPAASAVTMLAAIEGSRRHARVLEGIRAKLAQARDVLAAAPTPLPDVVALRTEAQKLQGVLDIRRQQLDGTLTRPLLPREEELRTRAQELESQLRGLASVPPPSEEEREIASRIKQVEHNCTVFGTGVCPTCSQEVKDFDPSSAKLEVQTLRKRLQEEEAHRKEGYEASRRGLLAEQRELQVELATLGDSAVAVLKKTVAKFTEDLRRTSAELETAETLVKGVEQSNRDVLSCEQQLQELGVPEEVDTSEADKLQKIVTLHETYKSRYTSSEAQLAVLISRRESAEGSLKKAKELRSGFAEVEEVDSSTLEEAHAKVVQLNDLRESQRKLVSQVGISQARVQSLAESVERLKGQYVNEANARKWVTLCKRVRDIVHVTGLPTLMMREYASVLNKKIAYYLNVWESPFSMKLDESLAFVSEFEDGRVHSASRLSGGQQIVASTSFRLAMVETFARELGLLVLDEPSNHLDTDNIYHLQQLLLRMRETACAAGRQILLVTHESSLGGFFDNTITLYK